jgi:phage anti-repressor protein
MLVQRHKEIIRLLRGCTLFVVFFNLKNMTELIKVTEKDGQQLVSARELYEFLGYDKSQWARWSKKNIVNDDFFSINVDYNELDLMSNGNLTKDYAITLDMAKELSMLARNEKGKEARKYFIAMEKKAHQLAVPSNFKEALLLAYQQQEQIEQQGVKIQGLEQALDVSEQWVSILRYAKDNGLKESSLNWRLLKAYSLEHGI